MRFSKGEVRDKVLREPPLDGDLSVSQPIPAAIAPSFLPQTSLYLLCKSTPIIYIESGASSSTSFIACFETPLLQEPLNSNNNSLKLASNKTSSSSCASGMPLSADAFNSLQYSNKQIAIRDSRFGLHLQLSRTVNT